MSNEVKTSETSECLVEASNLAAIGLFCFQADGKSWEKEILVQTCRYLGWEWEGVCSPCAGD